MPWQSSRANEATQYEQPFGGIIFLRERRLRHAHCHRPAID
jgi:hypothetical protein